MEYHETSVRGTVGDAAGLHRSGPLFRMDPGRDSRIQGVVQPGVDAGAAALDAAEGRARPPAPLLNASAAFHAVKDRHEPRTSLGVAARVSEGAALREALYARAQALLSPERIAQRLRQEADKCYLDAHRARQQRDRKEKERKAAIAHGEGVLNDAMALEAAKAATQQEQASEALGRFYDQLDARCDDVTYAEQYNYTTGKTTRLQRDFFLCSVRDRNDPSTLQARLPHLEKLAPVRDVPTSSMIGSAKSQQAGAASAGPGGAVDSPNNNDLPVRALHTTALEKFEQNALPVLGQYLGIFRGQFALGDEATPKQDRRGSHRAIDAGHQPGDMSAADGSPTGPTAHSPSSNALDVPAVHPNSSTPPVPIVAAVDVAEPPERLAGSDPGTRRQEGRAQLPEWARCPKRPDPHSWIKPEPLPDAAGSKAAQPTKRKSVNHHGQRRHSQLL
jgi:hypothetical protein